MIGDLIGKPGREAVEGLLPALRDERGIDFVTANGENVAGGMGLTPSTADAILASGVDVITSGNHIWDKREIYPYLEASDRVLRPLNYGTHEVPGRGWGTYQALDGTDLAVINLQGRTYMAQIENPFTDADRLLEESSEPLPPVRLVDFHCELTSEKNALGLYLDGRVSVVVGTHTHVVTGDERILPNGTAYLTDIGMTGPVWSVIGFEPRTVIPRFINALPTRFEVGSTGRSSSTPSRSTSIRRPVGRWRSSASSASWRRDVASVTSQQPPRSAAARRPGPGRAAEPVHDRPAHAHHPLRRDRAAGRAGRRDRGRRRHAPRVDRPRHAGRLPRGRRGTGRAARADPRARRRDQRHRHP